MGNRTDGQDERVHEVILSFALKGYKIILIGNSENSIKKSIQPILNEMVRFDIKNTMNILVFDFHKSDDLISNDSYKSL
jgi:hypothetical protein